MRLTDRIHIPRLSHRLPLLVLAVGLIPYAGLVLYLGFFVHTNSGPSPHPNITFLSLLFVVGVPLPLYGIAEILRKLVRERSTFNLRTLIEAYICLILTFATAFAIVQASSYEPAFRNMSSLWDPDAPQSFGMHFVDLHWLYFDALYLSAVTITTVGYGDIIPLTPWAKALTALEGLAGVGYLGLALGHYFSVCIHSGKDSRGFPNHD